MNSYRLEGSGDDAMKKLCVAYFSSKNDAVTEGGDSRPAESPRPTYTAKK